MSLQNKAYEHALNQDPSTVKIKVGGYQDFAKLVSSTTKVLDPRHTNVVIRTNGTVASVDCDFVFYIDGQSENPGSETWQLVKGTDGSRLSATRLNRSNTYHSTAHNNTLVEKRVGQTGRSV